ncbi:hypothetical protein F5884DRAFT_798409 [Xylogone sp. PMI_703]|nr:hypothetical protein F5884DRAFT_798409 [Xylogone sp. PMI_703]
MIIEQGIVFYIKLSTSWNSYLPNCKQYFPEHYQPPQITRKNLLFAMASFSARTTGDQVVSAFKSEVPGKTVLITGPSEGGIGAQTAIFLAAGKPKAIILAGRTKSKIQPVIDQIQNINREISVSFVQLDLADLSSVRHAAEVINSQVEKLDILINNAGIMAKADFAKSPDGIELQFAANHIGHFLFTNLIMPKIFAAGEGARIINIASGGYITGGVRFDDYNFKDGTEYNPWLAYGQSKTANILFASGLTARLRGTGVLAFSLEPGLVTETKLQADISQESFKDGMAIATKAANGADMKAELKTLVEGASTTLYAALAPNIRNQSGAFLRDCAVVTEPLMAHATGVDNQDKLWALSEKLVGQEFTYA